MALSGPEMAAENAVRFLADHLVGDRSSPSTTPARTSTGAGPNSD